MFLFWVTETVYFLLNSSCNIRPSLIFVFGWLVHPCIISPVCNLSTDAAPYFNPVSFPVWKSGSVCVFERRSCWLNSERLWDTKGKCRPSSGDELPCLFSVTAQFICWRVWGEAFDPTAADFNALTPTRPVTTLIIRLWDANQIQNEMFNCCSPWKKYKSFMQFIDIKYDMLFYLAI